MTTTARAGIVLRHIRGLAARPGADDRRLLGRFAARRDEAAFAELVRRHGPMVLGVCRRVLRDAHDAEDAFQATFLVLARKAAAAGRGDSVGGWLYRVAYTTALKARASAAARRRHESQVRGRIPIDALDEVTGRELLAVLDEELSRLPERERAPLVLCYLEGKARDEAAAELGWSLGTLKRRLEEGRGRLRARLSQRGLALPAVLLAAGAAASAVPAALAAETSRAAAGGAAAQVVALAEAVIRATSVGKLKAVASAVVAAVLVAGASLWALRTPAAAEEQTAAAAVPEEPADPAADHKKEMTVTGRVVGPDGKPVPGARVAVIARQGLFFSGGEDFAWYRNEVLGQAQADGEGKFRLGVARTERVPVRQVRLFAAADGLGLAWKGLDAKADAVEVEVRLVAEQVVRGRVIDLQGEPVAGAKVHVMELTHKPAKGEKGEGTLEVPPAGFPFGPVTATVDAEGRFVLRGLGPNLATELEVRDDRVARHRWEIDTADREQAEGIKLALPPGRVVEGRVTYEDTGRPVAGARLWIETAGAGRVLGTTDKEGRYRLNVRPPSEQFRKEGNDLGVHAFPPAGEPYWMAERGVAWPKGGATRQEVNVALPRAVLLRGKVTEAGTGKPVAGAYVGYNGGWMHRGATGPDGSFLFGVPAGVGRLTVNGPTDDYIPEVIGSAEILAGQKGGDRIYYHALVPLDLKRDEKEKELSVMLRRGVTLKGRVVDPDGKPVSDAVLFVGEHRPPHDKYLHPIRVRDGAFELTGCDPEKTYRLVFLDNDGPIRPVFGVEALNTYGQLWMPGLLGAGHKFGAAVELSAKEPAEVRLLPCGSAKVRFVDGEGKPLAKHKPWLQLVVTPGPPANQAIREGKFCAEVVTLISQYADDNEPRADEQGTLTLHGLVPGATYRVKKAEFEGQVLEEFTVEPGKTRELTVAVK
jgi:RNA polymerase sigma factor (sigma-70 family)